MDVSDDDVAWTPVDGGRTFVGNTDMHTHKASAFAAVVYARYVKRETSLSTHLTDLLV